MDGVCKSTCPEHEWALTEFNASARSVFAAGAAGSGDAAAAAAAAAAPIDEECQGGDAVEIDGDEDH